jgi:type IV secretory pathway component VirB8
VDNSPSKSRAQERALRAVSIVAIVSAMMNVALIMLVITLFPLQKVFPYLVTFKNQDNQVVSIEPMDIDQPGILYATEDNVRDYVTQRHSFIPNKTIMEARWGSGSKLYARTSNELYQQFANPARDETKRMLDSGYQRTVDINNVQRLPSTSDGETWQVNFTTHDSVPTQGGTLSGGTLSNPTAIGQNAAGFGPAPGAPVDLAPTTAPSVNDQTWVATLRVKYEPQRVTYSQRLVNPLGFTVTDYSVSATKGK